ncbi:MAG TPA: hypothetical protein VGQ93_03085 [Lysobacter sp.]|nr:hypothetical protein [Lysobacter sp.]
MAAVNVAAKIPGGSRIGPFSSSRLNAIRMTDAKGMQNVTGGMRWVFALRALPAQQQISPGPSLSKRGEERRDADVAAAGAKKH